MSGKNSQQRSRTVEKTATNAHVSIANPNIGYVASCLGPIIITAPHSCRLIKAPGHLKTQRNHKVERYTSSIAISLANEINKLMGDNSASFIIWQNPRNKKVNSSDLDPNYLEDHELPHSAFHQGLHKIIENNLTVPAQELHLNNNKSNKIANKNVRPMFHLDLHGKFPRNGAKAGRIDLGKVPAENYFYDNDDDYDMIQTLSKSFCAHINGIYKYQALGLRRLRPKADAECALHGFWGEDLHSMASQGSFLGIPSFQFEMEQEIRAQLATDETT